MITISRPSNCNDLYAVRIILSLVLPIDSAPSDQSFFGARDNMIRICPVGEYFATGKSNPESMSEAAAVPRIKDAYVRPRC